jgi:hypothetical protein
LNAAATGESLSAGAAAGVFTPAHPLSSNATTIIIKNTRLLTLDIVPPSDSGIQNKRVHSKSVNEAERRSSTSLRSRTSGLSILNTPLSILLRAGGNCLRLRVVLLCSAALLLPV